MTVIACIGHWYAQLLFLAPLILAVGVVIVSKTRMRLAARTRERSAREDARSIAPSPGL